MVDLKAAGATLNCCGKKWRHESRSFENSG